MMKTKYRALDGLRRGETGRAIDRIVDDTERDIDSLYGEALENYMRRNKAVFKKMQALMDGETKPPSSCVTDEQKERWKQKELSRILAQSGIAEELGAMIALAGDKAVSVIQRSGLEVFKTAHEGTLDELEG